MRKHTFFWISLEIYYCTVIPFGLKKARATYQRAVTLIFCDLLQKNIEECYVDDVAVKNRDKNNHTKNLQIIFNWMRAHQLKMNPTKSCLEVSSGKFLRFVVTSKEIHLDPNKIKATQNMQPIRNIKELQEHLTYIHHFMANIAGKCQPFPSLWRKRCH